MTSPMNINILQREVNSLMTSRESPPLLINSDVKIKGVEVSGVIKAGLKQQPSVGQVGGT